MAREHGDTRQGDARQGDADHERRRSPVTTGEELDLLLSTPSPALVALMSRLQGDLALLGAGGKMGVTLAMAACRAIDAAGVRKRVIAVSRFSDSHARVALENTGAETIACDLLDRAALSRLPRAKNVVYMAGRKFGTSGAEHLTWATNVIIPACVAEHFAASRIAAFSTGCVYPLTSPESGGSRESDPPDPIGEYAQSCLGRERVLEHYSRTNGTPVCLIRLNYAIDLRYGVLHDIGQCILQGRPVNLTVGHFNCIWQGDANNRALLALEACETPARPLNITGAETVSVRHAAEELAAIMERPVSFTGVEGGACYLSNAEESLRLFGPPAVTLGEMIRLTAEWLLAGGESLGKPTHFNVRDGVY